MRYWIITFINGSQGVYGKKERCRLKYYQDGCWYISRHFSVSYITRVHNIQEITEDEFNSKMMMEELVG